MVKGDGYHVSQDGQCTEGSPGCKTVTASPEEVHAVRCCSDVESSGWQKGVYENTCGIWAQSSLPGCKELNWFDANNVCETQSARLCTREELEAGCAGGTGCRFDYRLIWSNTPETSGKC